MKSFLFKVSEQFCYFEQDLRLLSNFKSLHCYCLIKGKPQNIDFNLKPSNKILDLAKLKEFSDDKTNVTEKLTFVYGQVENSRGEIWEKEKMMVTSIFLLFAQCFQKASSQGHQKSRLCGKELILYNIIQTFNEIYHLLDKPKSLSPSKKNFQLILITCFTMMLPTSKSLCSNDQ